MSEAVKVRVFTIPGMRLVSLANARTHWAEKARIAKHQRGSAGVWTVKALTASPPVKYRGPWTIVICRIGPRKLDSDNLAISAKHVRDGVADALGIDDGDETKVKWLYDQRTPKEAGTTQRYEVRVAFYPGSLPSASQLTPPAEPAPTPASKAKSPARTATRKTSGKGLRSGEVGK